MLLSNYLNCNAYNLAEAEQKVHRDLRGSTFALVQPAKNFIFNVNIAQFGDLTLVAANVSVPCIFKWSPADVVKGSFQVCKQSRWSSGRYEKVNNGSTSSGCLIPAGIPATVENEGGFESLTMRVDQAALARKLGALIGDDRRQPVFKYTEETAKVGIHNLRLALFQFARDVNQIGDYLNAPVLHEYAQSLIVKFLLYNAHDFSDRLVRQDALPSDRQLAKIIDFVHDRWEQPLLIEDLTEASGISARTIVRLFASRFGQTPTQFIKRIRLEKARIMLLGQTDLSVLSVATSCGFQSLGHFARDYRKLFGETPSRTLRATH